MTGIVAFSNFSGIVWTEKHLRRFQSDTMFSNFSGIVGRDEHYSLAQLIELH